MRKEVILAIIIGVILGGVVLYGLKLANESVENKSTETTTATPTVTLTPTPTPVDNLTIISPNDHSVSTTPTLNLQGRTNPNTQVAITSESSDDIIQSDAAGNFTKAIQLVGGENDITVTVLLPDTTTTSKSIKVIFTSSLDN